MIIMRLKENHPAVVALERVFEEMDKQGIRISFTTNRLTVEFEGKEYRINDIDHDQSPYAWLVDCLPPPLEYKLNYEKEDLEEVSVK